MSTGWLMFCAIALSNTEIALEIKAEVEYMSACHVTITEYNFEYPEEMCYCIQLKEE